MTLVSTLTAGPLDSNTNTMPLPLSAAVSIAELASVALSLPAIFDKLDMMIGVCLVLYCVLLIVQLGLT
jgi:hypothetical protein